MAEQQLIDALTHLLHVQRKLHKIAQKKTNLLIKNDVQQLNELLKAEANEVHVLEKAEAKRQRVVEQLVEKHKLSDEQMTLMALSPFLPEEEQKRLAQLQKQLASEIASLQTQNELNEDLTHRSLQYVNASLAMIAPEPAQATYRHPEQKKQRVPSQRSMFDSKA